MSYNEYMWLWQKGLWICLKTPDLCSTYKTVNLGINCICCNLTDPKIPLTFGFLFSFQKMNLQIGRWFYKLVLFIFFFFLIFLAFKVFWSSGRPLLCFSRFWPSENVARIRRVYVAYSRTKSVHTRNISSNAKGKCVFCFDCAKWSHYFIHRGALAARTKFHDVSTNEKRKV